VLYKFHLCINSVWCIVSTLEKVYASAKGNENASENIFILWRCYLESGCCRQTLPFPLKYPTYKGHPRWLDPSSAILTFSDQNVRIGMKKGYLHITVMVFIYLISNIWITVLNSIPYQFSSVQFSHSVMSNSLRPHKLQHARPPRPSPTLGVHSDSRPSSRWCHPAISSFVNPFSSCPQSLPASESFPMSQLFAWGGQSTGDSALASFPPKKSQGWSPSEVNHKQNKNVIYRLGENICKQCYWQGLISKIHSPGHISRESYNQKDACTPIFITALFTIVKTC